ncbi:MAG: glucosamine-6-phosphate deaminase [Acidobacteria bacterium]|nr:glucosamine-6-phosphate deaminase [Acidobacteriota bacterium]
MDLRVFESKQALAAAAAEDAAAVIKSAIAARGRAGIVAATGASQFEFLDCLVAAPGIDWARTVFFHLDEYIGLPRTHPASFRKYLTERIIERVHPGAFHLVDGEAPDPVAECKRLGGLIAREPIDVAFVGIGENGHLAFNDPPADFEIDEPYLVVNLDQRCRQQQLGEGWFTRIEDVPARAISMSIRQILRSQRIVCVVPDRRKAEAVRQSVEWEVSPWRPASVLRTHAGATLYLDEASASLLTDRSAGMAPAPGLGA